MMPADWDPYQQLMDLTQSNYEIAKALNEQAATIEKLIHNAKKANADIQNLNSRIAQLEITRATR